MLSSLAVQLFNGLAAASNLFLIAVGLSLIFGVTRIVNFAHGSMYMLGLYVAYGASQWLAAHFSIPGLSFWGAMIAAMLVVGVLGAVVELLVLRRVYAAPELFQLLATFAVVLLVRDGALWIWGADDLLGPKAPGMKGAIQILGRAFPQYDLFMIVVGPAVLGALWLVLHRTRLGILIRAATQDREMVGALGVNQAWLFTGIFALGSSLAALGGALHLCERLIGLLRSEHRLDGVTVRLGRRMELRGDRRLRILLQQGRRLLLDTAHADGATRHLPLQPVGWATDGLGGAAEG